MNIEAWKLWLDVVQFALTGIVAIFVWVLKQGQVNREAMNSFRHDVEDQLNNVGTRVTHIEGAVRGCPTTATCTEQARRVGIVEEGLKHAPTHVDMARIHARVDALTEPVMEIRGQVGAIAHQLETISRHLLEREHR
jgi:hypothetical protein